ncbi:hypothetical protein L7F22_032397 [Adiantum nelumboides]|nr:hypothetical protein [Adiantum nelumboides]
MESLVMEMITEGEELSVFLPRSSTLIAGHNYRVSSSTLIAGHNYRVSSSMTQAPRRGPRRFAAGLSVDPSRNYYIPPAIDDLVKDLKEGKYCLLCGARQSGKSTSVLAAMDRIWKESHQLSVYFAFGLTGADQSWDEQRLWAYLWDNLNHKHPNLFRARNLGEGCRDVQFRSLFLKEKLVTPVTIIIDEADSLIRLPAACIVQLFASCTRV